MAAQLVYARFPARAHRAALDWMRAVDDVLSVHAPDLGVVSIAEPVDGAVVGWRLVSDNHREIARGCRFFASERAARSETASLVSAAADLVVHAAIEPRLRTTGWFVTRGDQLVMIGARRYENRSVARGSGALAVRLLSEMADAASGAAVDERGERLRPEMPGAVPAGLVR